MAVCSFLGHHYTCDPNMQFRLQAAVNHLVEENESVEFLLYLWKATEPFYDLCLMAALRAKQRAPHKVTLTLVEDGWNLRKNLIDSQNLSLVAIVDRILPIFLPPPADNDPIKIMKKTLHWGVKQSTHIINGFYEDLFDKDNLVLDFARRRRGHPDHQRHSTGAEADHP